jgi:hypothetical protein
MATKKTGYVETYFPIEWIQTSGDVAKDAEYVLTITRQDWRNKELERLKWIHGQAHADQVRALVLKRWNQREQVREQAGAGKITLDQLIFENRKANHASNATR